MFLGLLPLGRLKASIILVITEPVIALFSGCTRETHPEAAPDPSEKKKRLRSSIVWFGCIITGLYEVIQYTLSLSIYLSIGAGKHRIMLATRTTTSSDSFVNPISRSRWAT